jgi:hypothetical protein
MGRNRKKPETGTFELPPIETAFKALDDRP